MGMALSLFFEDCRTYRVPLKACPSFLFLVLGLVIIVSMVGTHLVAARYAEEPQVATLIVIGVTVVLLSIGQIIVASFKRLAEAGLAKSEFISIASHQLRTPLSAIKWAGALLKSDDAYLEIIRDNAERMIRLVNDLLDINRIEVGGLPLEKKAFDLVSITRTTVARLTQFARASNAELRFGGVDQPATVLGDAERVRMVVEHLLDNAIRYSAGPGAAEVGIRREGAMFRWSVRDTGVGIPRAEQPRVFEKFFRAKNILTHETVGTGLGLFIAKSVIEALDGKIGFTSREGKGSTFWFTLPIAE